VREIADESQSDPSAVAPNESKLARGRETEAERTFRIKKIDGGEVT
jgi:hypothetical protein